MRHFEVPAALACAALLAAHSVAAFELPKPEDAQAQALLARAQVDLSLLEAAWNFAPPPAKEWPCEAPIGHLYEIAGLLEALKPEQVPEGVQSPEERRKALRRSYRKMGLDYSPGRKSFDKVVLVPVQASCADGKLDGDTQYYVSYESVETQKNAAFSPASGKMEETVMVTRENTEVMVHAQFRHGTPSGVSQEFRRGSIEVQVGSLPATQTPQRAATYAWPEGTVALFSMEMPEVSAGLFPSMKMKRKLMTMIMLNEGKYNRTFNYTDADLTGIGRENTETNTRLTVTYMEDVMKKFGRSSADIPALQGYKHVVIGGKDMLENQTCMIGGAPAKVDPCPVD